MNVSRLAPYAKAVVAVLGVVVLAAKALVDGQLTTDELVSIGTALGVAFGVYQVRNEEL